jgi:hypothetical protein
MATGFGKLKAFTGFEIVAFGIPRARTSVGAVHLGLNVRFTTPDWVSKQADKIAEASCWIHT